VRPLTHGDTAGSARVDAQTDDKDPALVFVGRGTTLRARAKQAAAIATALDVNYQGETEESAELVLEGLDIGQIPGPAGRALVADEVFSTDHRHRRSLHVQFHSSRPRVVELQAADAGQDGDTRGWHTDLEDVSDLVKSSSVRS
jgi:hypothetical protein